MPQSTPQPARSRKVTKAPNPLSQRKKKEIQTGRPSKKQLEAEKDRQAEMEKRRAEKRPRDERDSEDGMAEDKPAPSTRLEPRSADDSTGNGQKRPAEQTSTMEDDVDAEQKKRRRKRRKKATGTSETVEEEVQAEEAN